MGYRSRYHSTPKPGTQLQYSSSTSTSASTSTVTSKNTSSNRPTSSSYRPRYAASSSMSRNSPSAAVAAANAREAELARATPTRHPPPTSSSSSCSTTPVTPFRILDLPAEIRLQIWRHAYGNRLIHLWHDRLNNRWASVACFEPDSWLALESLALMGNRIPTLDVHDGFKVTGNQPQHLHPNQHQHQQHHQQQHQQQRARHTYCQACFDGIITPSGVRVSQLRTGVDGRAVRKSVSWSSHTYGRRKQTAVAGDGASNSSSSSGSSISNSVTRGEYGEYRYAASGGVDVPKGPGVAGTRGGAVEGSGGDRAGYQHQQYHQHHYNSRPVSATPTADDEDALSPSSPVPAPRFRISAMYASKALAAEILPVVYGSNTFELATGASFALFVDGRSPIQLAALRRLALDLVFTSPADVDGTEWLAALTPRRITQLATGVKGDDDGDNNHDEDDDARNGGSNRDSTISSVLLHSPVSDIMKVPSSSGAQQYIRRYHSTIGANKRGGPGGTASSKRVEGHRTGLLRLEVSGVWPLRGKVRQSLLRQLLSWRVLGLPAADVRLAIANGPLPETGSGAGAKALEHDLLDWGDTAWDDALSNSTATVSGPSTTLLGGRAVDAVLESYALAGGALPYNVDRKLFFARWLAAWKLLDRHALVRVAMQRILRIMQHAGVTGLPASREDWHYEQATPDQQAVARLVL